jgi:drug/metabolite transporter (DMT)-like permease
MDAVIDSSPTARSGALRMAAGGLLLGTIGLFVEEAGTDPLTMVWCRCAFGAVALLAWATATRQLAQLRLGMRGWSIAAAAGVAMAANWALFFASIERTSIAVATVVFHVQPLWLMLAGAWWLREAMPPARWLCLAVALGGLVLASGVAGSAVPPGDDYLLGLAMCIGASLSYTAVTLIAKQSRVLSPLALAWGQCVVGAVLLAAWPLQGGWPAAGPAWAWLAGLGIVHTGLAYVLLYGGMARLSSARIALLQFVYPASAIALDALVYGRTLDALQWIGVGVMAGALLGARSSRCSARAP